MARPTSPRNQPGEPEADTAFGCFIQMATGLGGMFLLVILTILIMRAEPWTFTIRDALFWLAVGGMIVAKHVELTRFGTTSEGMRGTNSSALLRYAIVLVAVAGGAWVVAQAVIV